MNTSFLKNAEACKGASVVIVCCLTAALISGCSGEPPQTSAETQVMGEREMENTGAAGGAKSQATSEPAQSVETSSETGPVLTVSGALSEAELQWFSDYLARPEHYGFLLSDYADVACANLNQVFYNGAGISQAPMTAEESSAYLSAVGATGFMTDTVHLSTAQIKAFLLQKTGRSFSFQEIKDSLDWKYLAGFDAFYAEHGDTNAIMPYCIDGRAEEGSYTLYCLSDGYSNPHMECELTLRADKAGNYQFCSNKILWDSYGVYKKDADLPTASALRFAIDLYNKEQNIRDKGFSEPVFDTDTRYYTKEEIRDISFSPLVLSVFKNEIYARHGYLFRQENWKEYFGACDWYQGETAASDFDTATFNEYEKANLALAVKCVN